MKEIKETTYKGTRILLGNKKREITNLMIQYLIDNGYEEISIPIIQYQEVFNGKVGEENKNLMFNFTDRGDRNICLAPEYTAVVQRLSSTIFKFQKDIKIFYVQECFRGENPQAGRYRQFTQLGVEIINPTKDYLEQLIIDSSELIKCFGISDFEVNRDVTRGLDYYKDGKGFEISYEGLGSSKQICGGGQYDGGIGFAIGVDRLLNII
jgi:histidyl-tRNA synthetase